MAPRIAKLAGLGAFGACGGFVALYLFVVFITRPGRLAGIDAANAAVAWIALGGLFAALIIVHVVIGKQLLRLAQGADAKHPL